MISISRFAIVSSVALAACASQLGQAAENDCNATVKNTKSHKPVAGSATWTFVFEVKTKCIASTGSFEYEYRIKGANQKPITRKAPAWNAGAGRAFTWTDEVGLGADQSAIFVRLVPGTETSTRVK